MNIFLVIMACLGLASFSTAKGEELSNHHVYVARKLLHVINYSRNPVERGFAQSLAAALVKFSRRSSLQDLIDCRTAWFFGDISKCIFLLDRIGEFTNWTQEYYMSITEQDSASAYQQAAMSSSLYDSEAAYSAASYPR